MKTIDLCRDCRLSGMCEDEETLTILANSPGGWKKGTAEAMRKLAAEYCMEYEMAE